MSAAPQTSDPAVTRNIVICSDGTSNTFGQRISNISRLIQLVELARCEEQLVFYDQGIGTDARQVESVEAYQKEREVERKALTILPPPHHRSWLLAKPSQLAGLVFGYGLRQNIKEMYQALAEHYRDGDQVYLFGFSRGAYSVRALAGLIYRCGLLPKRPNFDAEFNRAYRLYQPFEPDREDVAAFKSKHHGRSIEIRFLGLWDTVKSCGGIWPQRLPHLRHNPIVAQVCHALALDEHRSWFLPTSWGGLDSDDPRRLCLEDDERYRSQRIKEVWFVGCHADVGGGDEEAETAAIALRWMLNAAHTAGLCLNEKGREWITSSDPKPVIHESFTRGWRASEYAPRWELDNQYRTPKRFFKCGRTGHRNPMQFARGGKIFLHVSVGPGYGIQSEYVFTEASRTAEPVPSRHERQLDH